MKYGLIGGKLSHSFSPEIHSRLKSNPYELKELKERELEPFLKKRDFRGINVTIPYKQAVIPLLDETDISVKEIGAVNTIVNNNGRLVGYNTDFYGMKTTLERFSIDIKGRTVAILGTGGTAHTARAVCKALGAKEIHFVSRIKKEGVITYSQLYRKAEDIEVIINTTPVGMYPEAQGEPVDIDSFPALIGLMDVIYNPLRSKLVIKARQKGIAVVGGLYMLIAQGLRASELFTGYSYGKKELEKLYSEILLEKENIVLIGMPSSGKSTVGREIASILGMEFIDTDELIEKTTGKEITEIFAEGGERLFREFEKCAVKDAAAKTKSVIATGGGAVLDKENVERLKSNGRIIFLDRSLEELIPTPDRPLALNKDALLALYEKRYPIYNGAADIVIRTEESVEKTAKKIIGELQNEDIYN